MTGGRSDIATGTTVNFATSGFTGHLLDVSWDGIERVSVDTSHLGTVDFRTFIPGELTDPGELSLELAFDPDDTPPFNGAAEVITVTFPLFALTTPADWEANGFMRTFSLGAPLEEKMTATTAIKMSAAIAITAEV